LAYNILVTKLQLSRAQCLFTDYSTDLNHQTTVVITGQALLTIGMMSPSGHLMNDLSVKKQRPTTYQVSYTAPEKGDHSLVIRWGTDDIPGSPFTVHVS